MPQLIIIMFKDLFVECKYKFRAWFEMEKSTKVVVLSPEEMIDVALAAEGTRLFKYVEVCLGPNKHNIFLSISFIMFGVLQ